MCTDRSPATAN